MARQYRGLLTEMCTVGAQIGRVEFESDLESDGNSPGTWVLIVVDGEDGMMICKDQIVRQRRYRLERAAHPQQSWVWQKAIKGVLPHRFCWEGFRNRRG